MKCIAYRIFVLFNLFNYCIFWVHISTYLFILRNTESVFFFASEMSKCMITFRAPDLIEYAFVEVSFSDAKFMGGEYYNESCNTTY